MMFNIFKNKNCDNCDVWIPELRRNQNLHEVALDRLGSEYKNIKEHMRKMTEEFTQLRFNQELHSDVLNRQDVEIQKLREQINVLTILALGEPKDIASYQWKMWEKAKDELYPYYSTARECVDRQSRINRATEKYYALKCEMDVLKEDYEHLRNYD